MKKKITFAKSNGIYNGIHFRTFPKCGANASAQHVTIGPIKLISEKGVILKRNVIWENGIGIYDVQTEFYDTMKYI